MEPATFKIPISALTDIFGVTQPQARAILRRLPSIEKERWGASGRGNRHFRLIDVLAAIEGREFATHESKQTLISEYS